MKNKNLLLSLLIVTGMSAFAQSNSVSQIPANVKNTLTMFYPHATNVTWEQEQGYFIPVFTDNGVETRMVIDLKGAKIQTSIKLASSELPASATNYISKTYPGKPVAEARKLTMFNNSTRYEAIVGVEDLIFDSNGAFIRVAHSPIKQ